MDDKIKFKTPKQIEKELALIEKGDQRSWCELFLLLDSIDQTRFWMRGSNSFTGWIDAYAPMLHMKPAKLWRILSAGRFVRQVVGRLSEKGINIPTFEEMSDEVSPENIELLSKLSRVTSDETFVDFARRVFSGDVKRSELRGAWETYRPVLKGKTARGRGVIPPKLNLRDAEQYNSLMEADILNAFQAAGPGWTGIQSPAIYKVFIHVDPEGYRRSPISHMFAAVVVVKPKTGPVQYHGIRFPSFSRSPDSYKPILAFCDFLWVFNRKSSFSGALVSDKGIITYIPEGIGIIEVKDGNVTVIRATGIVDDAGIKRGDLASALLVRSLGLK